MAKNSWAPASLEVGGSTNRANKDIIKHSERWPFKILHMIAGVFPSGVFQKSNKQQFLHALPFAVWPMILLVLFAVMFVQFSIVENVIIIDVISNNTALLLHTPNNVNATTDEIRVTGQRLKNWFLFFCFTGFIELYSISTQLALSISHNSFFRRIPAGLMDSLNRISLRVIVVSAILLVGELTYFLVEISKLEYENTNVIAKVATIVATLWILPFMTVGIMRPYILIKAFEVHLASLIELANGNDADEMETELIASSKAIRDASAIYVQVPLVVTFIFGILAVASGAISLANPTDFVTHFRWVFIVIVLAFGLMVIAPLWVLTKIHADREEIYEILCFNRSFPSDQLLKLLAIFDAVAPEAYIFGIAITRGRVGSLVATGLAPVFVPLITWFLNPYTET
jgi:hypothetical protein